MALCANEVSYDLLGEHSLMSLSILHPESIAHSLTKIKNKTHLAIKYSPKAMDYKETTVYILPSILNYLSFFPQIFLFIK
jgi:hypothetical protein